MFRERSTSELRGQLALQAKCIAHSLDESRQILHCCQTLLDLSMVQPVPGTQVKLLS